MSEQELRNSVGKIFPSAQIAEKVVNILTSKKPPGWSSRSNAPYYRKVYAEDIKKYIDIMSETGQAICFDYETWCTVETGVSPATLYNRVNQSIRYLLDYLDADSKYKSWYELVTVERRRDVGVQITYIPGLGPKNQEHNQVAKLTPRMVEAKASKPVWLRKFDEWIEDESETEPFVKENLSLSPEEVTELKIRLAGLKHVEYSISQQYVKALKLNI